MQSCVIFYKRMLFLLPSAIRQLFRSLHSYKADTLCLTQDLCWQIATTSAVFRSNSIRFMSSVTLSVAVPGCSTAYPRLLHPPTPFPSPPWLKLAGWHHYQFLLSACRQKNCLRHSHYWVYKSRGNADSQCSHPSYIPRRSAARLSSHDFHRL